MKLAQIDLYDQEKYARGGPPQDEFALLRREDPLHWHAKEEPGGRGYWAVTKHADIVRMSKDPATFSSYAGGTLIRDYAEEHLEPMRLMLLNMDPPQHAKFRRLVSTGFTPRMIERLRPHVRERTTAILDRVAPRGECDFVREIAAELPLQVIGDLLGIPEEDREKIFHWTNQLMGFDDPEYQVSVEDGVRAAGEMWAYAHELATKRKGTSAEDLAGVLMNATVDGEQLTEAEFDSFFLLLAVAGNETTRNATSGGMLALIEHPEEREKLLANPALLPSAVEEILRWTCPQIYMRRTATRDVEMRGKTVKAGDKLAMYYTSANRDEEVFSDPLSFKVDRAPNDHLTFGVGQHFCLGANLARLELTIMFEEILRRMPEPRLAGPLRRLRSNYMNGIKAMPLAFRAT
ncbi:MAG: cytochrome P450 [Candidatus Methylomirabilis sp.]|nr:cytochrome P450 [Deltaproteobacteria bacterium]